VANFVPNAHAAASLEKPLPSIFIGLIVKVLIGIDLG
jgi:hypothetical protein